MGGSGRGPFRERDCGFWPVEEQIAGRKDRWMSEGFLWGERARRCS